MPGNHETNLTIDDMEPITRSLAYAITGERVETHEEKIIKMLNRIENRLHKIECRVGNELVLINGIWRE